MLRRIDSTWFAWGTVFVGVAALIGVIWAARSSWMYAPAVSAVSSSFLVAAVLALTVDGVVKLRFITEVTRDVFASIVGHSLPEQIQDRIKELMNTSLTRSRYCVQYVFHGWDKGFVFIDVCVRYEVNNWTRSRKKFAPPLAVEALDCPHFVSMSIATEDGTTVAEYSEGQLALLAFDAEGGQVRELRVEPVPISPGKSLSVRIHYHIAVREYGSDPHTFGEFTLGAEVSALRVPDGLEFSVSSGNRAGNTWHIPRLFAPGEHVRVRWHPKEQQQS